jgi:hypothetical protein
VPAAFFPRGFGDEPEAAAVGNSVAVLVSARYANWRPFVERAGFAARATD